MEKANKNFQQGDVTGRKIDSLPEGTPKIISTGKCVLAEGEVTGHYHGIEETDAELIEIGEKIILSLKNDAILTHQEHGPITLTPGLWEIDQINEYDYFSKMKKKVVD